MRICVCKMGRRRSFKGVFWISGEFQREERLESVKKIGVEGKK